MKIATWNVNSVRARLECLKTWIELQKPDVILMQEIKCQLETFPFEFFEEYGYISKIWGQKTYNGVAIVSKFSIEDVSIALPTFKEDSNARYIEAIVGGNIRIASVYVPGGGDVVGGASYLYKLAFLEKLQEHLKNLNMNNEPIFAAGDYNITIDDFDVYDPKLWFERVCCTAKERGEYANFECIGYKEVLSSYWQQDSKNLVNDCKTLKRPFTWWDYKNRMSFTQNKGLRLDHILTNDKGFEMVKQAFVDSKTRSMLRPSDHAPVIWEI